MTYDWNKMVEITVPVGINGWVYAGSVTINGVTVDFPIGIPTSVPEPVAELLKKFIALEEDKNKVPTPGAGGGGVQPDWNQNDPNAADYVKNRTHYEETVNKTLLDNMTVTFQENPEMADIYMGFVNTLESITEKPTAVVIVWDGIEYLCKQNQDDFNGTFGNVAIVGGTPDTGEPFLAVMSGKNGFAAMTMDTAAEHTISLKAEVTSIVKLPLEYIDAAPLYAAITEETNNYSAFETLTIRAGTTTRATVKEVFAKANGKKRLYVEVLGEDGIITREFLCLDDRYHIYDTNNYAELHRVIELSDNSGTVNDLIMKMFLDFENDVFTGVRLVYRTYFRLGDYKITVNGQGQLTATKIEET